MQYCRSVNFRYFRAENSQTNNLFVSSLIRWFLSSWCAAIYRAVPNSVARCWWVMWISVSPAESSGSFSARRIWIHWMEEFVNSAAVCVKVKLSELNGLVYRLIKYWQRNWSRFIGCIGINRKWYCPEFYIPAIGQHALSFYKWQPGVFPIENSVHQMNDWGKSSGFH